jgi:hypothetical protein
MCLQAKREMWVVRHHLQDRGEAREFLKTYSRARGLSEDMYLNILRSNPNEDAWAATLAREFKQS